MYGNPYMPQYNPTQSIDRQIEELQNLKTRYSQPPVTNIINTQTPNISEFEARYLKENEKVDEIIIQRKTAFIDLKNSKLSIKEINGDITTYDILVPKDEKDLKIENLESKIKELEAKINANKPINEQSDDTTNNEIGKSKTSSVKSTGK